ncbi:MAG: chalcone isomerase family protein [Myxococcales bacterium]|nr:chalcone isomerase family protein [Myxococcales bacterium]MCB9648228.1 chalcone isomerase family protein [Deltaproteobacteria bacterium]
MRGILQSLTILGALATVSTSALAASREGVTLPDSQKVGEKELVLNGIGIREATIFNVNVYVAGLYVEEKTGDAAKIISPEATKKILMHFVRDVDASDIQGAYNEGFEKNADGKMAALKDRVAKLNSWMADMKKGDKMSITYVAGQGVTVNVKGKDKGTIEGADFAKVMFTIFFGPKPPNSDLKEGMLGQKK